MPIMLVAPTPRASGRSAERLHDQSQVRTSLSPDLTTGCSAVTGESGLYPVQCVYSTSIEMVKMLQAK